MSYTSKTCWHLPPGALAFRRRISWCSFIFAITPLLFCLRAGADPVLIVSDGVTSSGPITLTGGAGTYKSESFDGSWSVVITTGASKPAYGSAISPNLELDIIATSLGSANPLTITLSDNSFGPISGNNSLVSQFIGHAFGGAGGAVTFNTYYDTNNTMAALTSPLALSGEMFPGNTGYFSAGTNSLSLPGPFSLSEVVQISGGNAATYSLAANLQSVPSVIGEPAVSITYPTNGQVFIAPATFNVMAVASDSVGTITNVQFLSSTNGTDFIFLGQTNNSPYLTIASNLPPGTYTFVAQAADNFGATAQSQPVTVQVVPPQPPDVNAIGHLTLNYQDGYQWLSNVVCNPVNSRADAVRVYIHNITNSAIKVVNASGTTNGVPYIESPAAIQPGTCWTNVIMFYDPVQAAFSPTLSVELVPVPNAAGNPTGITVSMLPPRMLADGTFLIEFPSANGASYYVQYSSDMVNWNTSFPGITGTGQRMQWIDSGPPATASLPAANVTRFYRVIQAQ